MDNQFSQSPSAPSPAPISSLPGATAILGQAWAIYKQRLGTFLGVVIIPILVIIAAFVGGNFLNAGILSGGIGLIIISAILFVIVVFISQIWGQTALLYAIKDHQERIGILESYRRGWHKIFSYLWVALLSMLIIVGGSILLVVPGIIFAIWFSLAVFILIAEDFKGMNALLKSKEYVKGRWGSIFWRFFVIGVLFSIISLILTISLNLLKVPFGTEIGWFIMGLFLAPLTLTYSFLVYSNLKAVKGEIIFSPTGGQKTAFVFIGILGVLALFVPTILLSTLGSAREKARDAIRQSDIRQIQIELETYRGEHSNYPVYLNELSPQYLPSTLVDPSTNQPYQYQPQQNGKGYEVCAQLESTKTQKCVTSQY